MFFNMKKGLLQGITLEWWNKAVLKKKKGIVLNIGDNKDILTYMGVHTEIYFIAITSH